ncbi:MAG TPA: DUF2442 domain-containing protein [Longimicrobiaceae bacterium]|nr:DUF2442 domain-containing protein [Longimicrobiaceae bacterium]
MAVQESQVVLNELDAELEAARVRAEYEDRIEPRAVKAWYDARCGLVTVELKNGCIFGFPPPDDPYWELAGVGPDQLAKVELDDNGRLLLWDDIDAGIVLPGLLLHLLNVKAWCAKWYDETCGCDPLPEHEFVTYRDLDAQIEAAREAAVHQDRIEPRVAKAWYDREGGRVMITLKNGCLFGFPPPDVPRWGLVGATADQLAKVEPDCSGEGLHWESLDADLSVPGLLLHLLNVKEWCGKWFGVPETEADAPRST